MYRLVERIARCMAILGGLVLVALVILTSVSVTGRGLNTLGHSQFLTALSQSVADWLIATGVAPVTGDFELVEAGVAFAIFAFLPICQLYSEHATVDLFTSGLSAGFNKILLAFWDIVLTLTTILLTQRLYAGMMSKKSYGETTFLLEFPIWWAYALSLFAAIVATLVGVYCAGARLAEIKSGRAVLPVRGGSK